MRIIIIVPAFNESAIIGRTIQALTALKPDFAREGHELQVFLVDDGSSDQTSRMAHEAGADRVIRHKVNRGLGAAVRSGLLAAREAGADIVVKFDGDLQHDPADIRALIQPILEDDADIVYGNRFERIQYRMPLVRWLGNKLFTSLMGYLTGWSLRDSQPGILAVHRGYLQQFYLPGDYNYTQQILIDAFHQGMRFAHVPVTFRPRSTGKSFISLKYPFKVLPIIFMMLVMVKPLRVFGPIGLFFFAIGSGLACWEFTAWLLSDSPKPILHVNAVLGFTLFGVQTLFFGILAQMIVAFHKRR